MHGAHHAAVPLQISNKVNPSNYEQGMKVGSSAVFLIAYILATMSLIR
jgi:hypothetical protein